MRIEGNDQRLAAATAAQMQQGRVQQAAAPVNLQKQETNDSGKNDAVQTIMGDKVSIKIDLPKHNLDTLHKMGSITDFLNTVATSLRSTNEGLIAVSNVVEDMKSSLDYIVKIYPPYPIDSNERVERLMQYSSFKKEIQSMTVPAPPPPMYEKVRHLWTHLFNAQDGSLQTPDLPTNAPDSHLSAAIKQLDSVSGQIDLVREALSNSVKS